MPGLSCLQGILGPHLLTLVSRTFFDLRSPARSTALIKGTLSKLKCSQRTFQAWWGNQHVRIIEFKFSFVTCLALHHQQFVKLCRNDWQVSTWDALVVSSWKLWQRTMDDFVAVEESQASSHITCNLLPLIPPRDPVGTLQSESPPQVTPLQLQSLVNINSYASKNFMGTLTVESRALCLGTSVFYSAALAIRISFSEVFHYTPTTWNTGVQISISPKALGCMCQ